ncbi:hypothetical protein TELCIR_23811, partial [Teladorsagia circumcincta]
STLKEKAWGTKVDEESVTKLDSQGGKVQVSSVVEHTTTASADQPPSSGGDFLSGLMNVAQNVGKALGEQNQTGSAANASGNTAQQQGGPQLSQEDIARISAGLGSLGGHDFLSGLLNVAKDVGKVVEQNQYGTDTTSSGRV